MRNRVIDLSLRIVGWLLIAMLLVVAFLVLAWGFGIAWCIAIFVVVEIVRKSWVTRQYALLWLLTVSAERSMPLAPAVAALARERGGRFGQRARRLVELLDGGVPLPNALERVGGLMPPRALSMVRVGYESGALAPALRQAAEASDLNEPIWLGLIGHLSYVLLVPTFGVMMLVFIMLKIMPQFQKIFQDFDTSLPPMTQMLISGANLYAHYWYLFPFPLLGLVLLAYAMMRYWGWTDWDLPGAARLVRRYDSAQVLDSLSLVARQQRPLSEGIASLAQSYPKRDIRRRLQRAEADIRGGRDWCESLRARGLIKAADLAILQAAQRVGNLAWALHEMAESARRRLAYRLQAIIQITFPLVVVFLGLMVMFIVVALFLPLIALIQHLAV
jgi:type II secretory pathway component PulF